MKNLIIDTHASGTRVCVVENGNLIDFAIEKTSSEKLVGNIYKGKVVNVLKGMQAVFVDIGLEKNGFLYGGDICFNGKMISHNGTNAPDKIPLKVGDIIMCQVLKDQFGTKGPRLTMNISLPSRVLVMEPLVDYIAISRKIDNEDERNRLENLVKVNRIDNSGYIVRTEAETCSEEELLTNIKKLNAKWQKIKNDYIACPKCSLLYSEGDLVIRAVRDFMRGDIDKIIVNDIGICNMLEAEFSCIFGKKKDIFEVYTGGDTLTNHFNLNPQIEKLLKREVMLSNGAYLVIDKTEALTVIDVNTGKYVGDQNLEATVFMTNKIAAVEIARQIRLRNLGGIIIVDFIDMYDTEHRKEVLELLAQELKKDRLKCTLVGMTDLGLVQITRKKMRSMLYETMLQECPYCKGDAYVQSVEHIIMRIRDYLYEIFKDDTIQAVKLTVNPILFSKMFSLNIFEKELNNDWANLRIYLIPDPLCHIEKFSCERVRSSVIELPDNAKLLY
ncbi:MAG: Rne/Rng family ribonuclease [Clostridia bacterium]|nr:Rne/Rng family ribonuclease [Clostridia bacterium]